MELILGKERVISQAPEGVLPLGHFNLFKKGPDGAIWSPLYKHFIQDGGYTSAAPEYFDDRGVLPRTIRCEG